MKEATAASKAALKIEKLSLPGDVKTPLLGELKDIEEACNLVAVLDKHVVESACVAELPEMFDRALSLGFQFSADHCGHILMCQCQEHLRLRNFDSLQALLNLHSVARKFRLDLDVADEMIALIVETAVSQLIKECTKEDCKLTGPKVLALKARVASLSLHHGPWHASTFANTVLLCQELWKLQEHVTSLQSLATCCLPMFFLSMRSMLVLSLN